MKVKKLGRKALSFLLAILMILYSVPIMSYASLLSSEDDASSQYDTTELAKDAFEVIELREENVKQFRLEDGTYVAAQYEKPVHYLDENNIWQNIDNTLEDYGSEFATSNERIKFSKKITGNEVIFTLHENNRKLTLSLDGAIKKVSGTAINTKTDFDESDTKLQKLMTLDTLSSKVIYQDILDGVDLEYVVDSYDIKENIIVKKKNDSYKYTFTLKLNNLTAALNSSGDVVISDSSTDEIVYIIPAPVVYDANDVYASSNTAEYTLVAIETNTYSLSVTVDSDWMNDEDRAYPVVIDPPLSVATSQYTDLYIDESLPNSTIDSEFRLIVSSGNRAYWKASTLPNIPDSAYIYKATLSLKSAMADNGFVGAYRITSDWDSTLTWNKTTSSTPQGSFSTDVLDHNQIKPSIYNTYEDTDDVWYEWNITEAVDAWYSGTANYGIGFKNVDDTATSVTWFHSREAVSRSNMPRFAVYYKDMKGIESYWTYASQSVGFAGTGYVNYATGALTFGKSLLSTTDSLMPFTPSLVYNSSLAGKAFKYPNAQVSYWGTYEPLGFKLSIHETIIKKEYISADGNEGSMYILSDEDGTEHYFLPTLVNSEPSTTVYQDADGLQLILNTSSTQLTITDNSQTVRTYNKLSGVPSNSGILSGWYLESITDANGNKIKIDFEAGPNPCTISLVPNGSQQIDFLTIAYNSYYVPYMIWNQTTKEALIFKYSNTPTGSITATSETKYLRKIEYVRSNVALTKAEWKAYAEGSSNSSIESLASASYTYNSSGYLTKAKDELSGYEVRYTYSSGKITTIQEYVGSNAGQKFGITYHTGYTEVRSPGSDDAYGNADDIITRYVFDLEGRVTSMYSMDSGRTKIHGASSGVYEKQDNVKNNLKTTVVVGGNAANYILNGGFSDIKDSKAEHWTKTSNVSFPIESVDKDGQRHAEFNIDGISTESLKQYVRLNEGDYTLSVYVNAYDCQNTKMYLKMRSLDNTNNIYEKQVPINEFYSIENGAYASLHFSADNFNSTGYENFELSIIVKGVTSTAEATVKVDNVMLEENIGVSNYNMVQYGSFEKTSIDSSGNYLSNIVNYWENESGGLIRGLTSNVFGYTGYIEGSLTEEKYLKQTVYKADPNVLAYYDNGGSYGESEKTYLVSGFAKGTAQLPSESAPFRIRVDVSYYHGINQEIEVISEKFDFNKF